jgi:hypothetical protein
MLRTEREKGHLGFKMIAGKVTHRITDLTSWLNEGEKKCLDKQTPRGSNATAKGVASGISAIARDGAANSRRALAAARKLRSTSDNGSETADRVSTQVTPMKSP